MKKWKVKEIKTEKTTGEGKKLRKVGKKKNTNFKMFFKTKCEEEIKWNMNVRNYE